MKKHNKNYLILTIVCLVTLMVSFISLGCDNDNVKAHYSDKIENLNGKNRPTFQHNNIESLKYDTGTGIDVNIIDGHKYVVAYISNVHGVSIHIIHAESCDCKRSN